MFVGWSNSFWEKMNITPIQLHPCIHWVSVLFKAKFISKQWNMIIFHWLPQVPHAWWASKSLWCFCKCIFFLNVTSANAIVTFQIEQNRMTLDLVESGSTDLSSSNVVTWYQKWHTQCQSIIVTIQDKSVTKWFLPGLSVDFGGCYVKCESRMWNQQFFGNHEPLFEVVYHLLGTIWGNCFFQELDKFMIDGEVKPGLVTILNAT
jgi:hypothetical protein